MGKSENNTRYQHLLQTMDTSTGEIVRTRVLVPGGRDKKDEGDVKFLHPRTKRASIVTGRGGRRAWKRLEGMRDEDVGRLMRLAPYVGKSNRLEKKGKWLTVTDMGKELGIHRVTALNFMQRCEVEGVMARGVDGGIYMNPLVLAGCDYLPLVVFGLFRDDLVEFLPVDVVKEYEGRLKGEQA